MRKNIILLLKTQDDLVLSFNEILKKLVINSSSVLAFHLKKLVNEEILIKEKIRVHQTDQEGKSPNPIMALFGKVIPPNNTL